MIMNYSKGKFVPFTKRGMFSGIVVVSIIWLILIFWVSPLRALLIVGGAAGILFLPGFFTTLIFFPFHEKIDAPAEEEAVRRSLDIIERVAFALAFSIVISSLLVYFLHHAAIFPKFGFSLTPHKLVFTLACLNVILGACAIWRQKWFRSNV